MRTAIIFLILFFASNKTEAQFIEKFKFWKEDTVKQKDGIFIFPLLYYTPDTRFAAGIVGVYYFNTGKIQDSEGPETRLSYVKLLGDYTQNRQLDLWSSWNIFTNQEKYLFKGEIRYRNFPDRFYGIGNNTPASQEEFYSYDLFNLKLLGMKQVYRNLFVGLDYQLTREYNFELEEGGILETQDIIGARGGLGSAIGTVLTYDTRDNVVNAYSGMLFEASTYFYDDFLGSDFSFVNINLTYNKYWQIKKDHIIGFNSVVKLNYGGVPFLDMSKAGSSEILRGYAENRFRDHHFAGFQVEYRFPVWWRFGMVVFSGLGDVFRYPSDLQLNTLKYSFGAGIRFSVNPKERLNVRFDYGFGRNNNAFYIMLTEAF
ncbi:MAG: BamA/TamA family outer membrane protein [Brumimicrobium sp.]|nr:BamA/TamA family outer membrane protein [Brumimicrobium sp.]